MSKISELSDGGALQSTDYLIAVRSGGNVKVQPNGTVTGTTGSFSGNVTFADNAKAIFGAGSDLAIYHDGVSSTSYFIESNPTGNMEFRASSLRLKEGDGVNYYFLGVAGGASTVYHNGSAKLATTASGIDVTGTVTADGLTVDGNASAQTYRSSRTDGDVYIQAATDTDFVRIGTQTKPKLFNVDGSGDISFYEDTGTTPKFFWDASAEALGIGTASPEKVIHVKTAVNNTAFVRIESTATDSYPTLSLKNDAREYQLTAHGPLGDKFTIYDGTAGSHRFVIDSAGNVGIGTSSPAQKLHVYGSNATAFIDAATGTSYPTLQIGGSGTTLFSIDVDLAAPTTNGTLLRTQGGAYPLRFGVNTTERMRLDASGNLLVGKTTTTYNDAGTQIGSDGRSFFTADGNYAGAFNRLTSDGEIIRLSKDGTTVGSIGTDGSNIYVGTGDTTLKMDASNNAIFPRGTDGAQRDAAIQLGSPGNRFTDLYLSGGVYLGGTGVANLLDDYETGTFTATFDFSTSSTGALTYNRQTGRYIKIGNVVYISLWLSWTANNFTASTGALVLTGLPFTQTSAQAERGGLYIAYTDTPFTGLTIYQQALRVEAGSTNMTFNFSDGTDGSMSSSLNSHTQLTSSGSLMISGAYHVD